jgi:hypothetical protein
MTRGRPGAGRPRARRRAGWWFWGPFGFGLFFVVGAAAFLAGASRIGAGSGGLALTGVIWLVIGLASIGVALYARHDIGTPDEAPRLEGVPTPEHERRLRATGTRGSATIRSYRFLGRHFDGGTLVELELSVAAGPVTREVADLRLVPVERARDLGVGATVPIFCSLGDPGDFVVDWSGLRPVPATS